MFVSAAATDPDGYRRSSGYLFIADDSESAFNTVGTIDVEFQTGSTQKELFLQSLHVRVIFQVFIEYEVPFAVERFQIGLYTGEFICFLLLISIDI